MRPRKFYTIFEMGRVTGIAHGTAEAIRLSPHRAYRAFRSRRDAEEYATWHNYDHDRLNDTKVRNAVERMHQRRIDA